MQTTVPSLVRRRVPSHKLGDALADRKDTWQTSAALLSWPVAAGRLAHAAYSTRTPSVVTSSHCLDAHGTPTGTSQHFGSDCPTGVPLAPSDTIVWTSDGEHQGSVGNPWNYNNGCATKGTCGLPWSRSPLKSGDGSGGGPHPLNNPGGGWQICFQ